LWSWEQRSLVRESKLVVEETEAEEMEERERVERERVEREREVAATIWARDRIA
jgi:hypothetical protein